MILSREILGGFCESVSHPVYNLANQFAHHAGVALSDTQNVGADLTLNHS
jgi:hypothetical protein